MLKVLKGKSHIVPILHVCVEHLHDSSFQSLAYVVIIQS